MGTEKRKLKHWVITAENVKGQDAGFVAYYNYLGNKYKHQNQIITELTSKANVARLATTASLFNLHRKMNGGGRPSDFAWSITLPYPFPVSDLKLKALYQRNSFEFIKYVSEQNKLDYTDEKIREIVNHRTIAFTHTGKNIKSHIHLLLPKHFDKDGTTISIDLTKKKYLHRIKLINDANVLKLCSEDKMDYQIHSKKKHNKRIAKHQYQKQKEQELTAETNLLTIELNQLMEAQLKRGVADPKKLKLFERAKQQLNNRNTQRARKTIEQIKSIKPKRR